MQGGGREERHNNDKEKKQNRTNFSISSTYARYFLGSKEQFLSIDFSTQDFLFSLSRRFFFLPLFPVVRCMHNNNIMRLLRIVFLSSKLNFSNSANCGMGAAPEEEKNFGLFFFAFFFSCQYNFSHGIVFGHITQSSEWYMHHYKPVHREKEKYIKGINHAQGFP